MTRLTTAYFKLLRPHQWLKNSFVLLGVVFGHALGDGSIVYKALLATIGFSLLASSIYIFNDIIDIKSDQRHAVKKQRPLAAGVIAPQPALILAVALMSASLAASHLVSKTLGGIFLGYIALNAIYFFWLKNIVFIDALTIAGGFLLRILAGTLGIGIAPSMWLLLCGSIFALFLSFCKRFAEYDATFELKKKPFPYTPAILNSCMILTAAGTILTYVLYTLSPATFQAQKQTSLFYTTFFIVIGILRYFYLLKKSKGAMRLRYADLAWAIFQDCYLLLIIFGWSALTLYLIYA